MGSEARKRNVSTGTVGCLPLSDLLTRQPMIRRHDEATSDLGSLE